jgi:(1->4)-alpha-D-glucan 1-alpha-D-glucosylmutase
VPDFYQGTELWDLSLVDPDNRRPVDFTLRAAYLAEVEATLALAPADRIPKLAELVASWRDGRIKLLTTVAGLRLRRGEPDLFLSGRYVPLETECSAPGSAVAFARVHGDSAVLFIGPRLCASLVESDVRLVLGRDRWKTSHVLLPPELASRTFRHELTGAEILPATTAGQAWMLVGQVFEHVPLGILRAV